MLTDLILLNIFILTSRSASLNFSRGVLFVLVKSRVELASLEAPRLIHVDPDAVEGKLLVEISESLPPHVCALVIEPVDEDRNLGPNLINKVVVVLGRLIHSRLDEDIILVTHCVILVGQILG
jgi:hypothetical protein